MRKLWLLAVLGACTTKDSSTSLAQLVDKYGATNVEIVATSGQVNIEMHVAEAAGCPQLSDDVSAQFDGQNMLVARGGYDTNSTGCYPIAFWFDSTPTVAAVGFEAVKTDSELMIADASATWQINTSKLLSNDFVIDAAASSVVWEDVSTITTAMTSPNTVTSIVGNTINLSPGTLQWVEAYAHPVATQCAGPSECVVDVQASRNWTGNPQ
jgi:hypothetical protein